MCALDTAVNNAPSHETDHSISDVDLHGSGVEWVYDFDIHQSFFEKLGTKVQLRNASFDMFLLWICTYNIGSERTAGNGCIFVILNEAGTL